MKKHILVIDDEMIVTQVLAKLLTRCLYKVTIALDGQQGIDMFRANPPDLVIIDNRFDPMLSKLTLRTNS